MSGISKSNRSFAPRKSCQTARLSTVFRHNEYVHTSHAVGSKSNLLTIRTPNRCRIKSWIGSDLRSLATGYGDCKNVTFVGECNGSSIGRDSTMTHPQRILLCPKCSGKQKGHSTHEEFFHFVLFKHIKKSKTPQPL